MAFTGAATVTPISDKVARITGVSLAAGASGVIGLFGSGLEVVLPDSFNPTPYARPDNANVSLSEAVRVTINPVTDVSNFAIPIRVVKTEPAGVFTITLTNDEAAVASAELEIYVEWLS